MAVRLVEEFCELYAGAFYESSQGRRRKARRSAGTEEVEPEAHDASIGRMQSMNDPYRKQ
jgi:hypothetical protein